MVFVIVGLKYNNLYYNTKLNIFRILISEKLVIFKTRKNINLYLELLHFNKKNIMNFEMCKKDLNCKHFFKNVYPIKLWHQKVDIPHFTV